VSRLPASFEPPEEFDDYVIVRPLGHGAMGHVYLAQDSVLARAIAIKFIGVDPDPAARQRFLMEARAAARIQHPNVVSIYRVGELGDRPYIVSELVRGTALSDVVRPLTWPRVLEIAIDLARGLAAAHRNGVVHCDIKPGNVMVTEDGLAKLVDFGLARVIRDDNEVGGSAVGTPDYMPPEVWSGSPPTRRSDVYSLGAVVYELLAGTPPFAAIAPAELGRTVQAVDAPELPNTVDARLAAIVARCLSRDPAARFASGEELREALERLAASRTQTASPDQNPYRGLRPFESTHRGVFFGRGLEISAIVERLRTETVVVVAGDSGVGKSSLCRAGVVPAVTDGGLGGGRTWRALTVVPGRHPLSALGAALGDPELGARVLEEPGFLARELHRRAGSDGLILFVDQMEELVTVGDPVELTAFDAALAQISEGVAGVRVITTVRSDFLTRLVALPRFGQELSRVLYFVRPLPPERLRDVITGPAAATNVSFESEAMISELVDATAAAGSGGLPLLSFALAELWEARDRDRGLITQATLDMMGGVAGALARHGDAVIAGMVPADRAHARRVLLRLVTSVGTRVRRSEAELSVSENTRDAVAALVRGRLLVVHDGEAGPTYELAHEVLIRGWGTLRDWLDADAEDRARRERLAEACAEWQRLERRGDATWRGTQLEEALALDATNLTTVEREFISASVRATRRRTWLRRSLGVGALVLIVTVYGVQRFVVNHRLAGNVDAQLVDATEALDTARRSDHEQQALAAQAFAKFDGADTDGGEAMWSDVVAKRGIARRAYRAAGRGVEGALAMDPTRADVRALLGDILLERAELAELEHDSEIRDEVVSRLPDYDADGSRMTQWTQPGHVVVRAPKGTISIDGKPAGVDSVSIELAIGLHLVEVTTPDRAAVREPILVDRGATVELQIAPPPASSLPAGYVYVTGGSFRYGSAADDETRRNFLSTAPLHQRTTHAFLIARDEVTFADWLGFVDAQPEPDRAKLLPYVSVKSGRGIEVTRIDHRWTLQLKPIGQLYSAVWGQPIRYEGRDRRVAEDWGRFPVLGISAANAEAYVTWLDTTGRLVGARLCTEVEWERAARGPDGRNAPSDHVIEADDANIDNTYGRDHMGPDEVGSHPASTSPYGLNDMAGNAFEWTRGERAGTYVTRGGSYYHDRKTADLANRNETSAGLRDAALGMRVCVTPHD
jgi:eukaryotic-like serine/threonine-protein kinase